MRSKLRPMAVVFGILATLITTVIRVLLTPGSQDQTTGQFNVSYVIIAAFVVSILAIGLLVFAGKSTLAGVETMTRRQRLPMAISGILLGSVFVLVSLLDGWVWVVYGLTPPPNEIIISKLDYWSLTFTLLFGVLAGLFFIWLGFMLLMGSIKPSAGLSLGALTPVIWIWVRLVRFEVSYASATQVEQSFYDVLMLIFTMLFLFAFARYISRVGERSPRLLLVYSLGALLFSVSGYLSQVALFALGETAAYNASQMAGFMDLFIGIFALCTAWSLVFGRAEPERPAEDDTSVAPMARDNGDSSPTVDDILRDLNKGSISD